jgi:hypothetical protein
MSFTFIYAAYAVLQAICILRFTPMLSDRGKADPQEVMPAFFVMTVFAPVTSVIFTIWIGYRFIMFLVGGSRFKG